MSEPLPKRVRSDAGLNFPTGFAGSYIGACPFAHGLLDEAVSDDLLLRRARAQVLTASGHGRAYKESDLYKMEQTLDLSTAGGALAELRDLFFSAAARERIAQRHSLHVTGESTRPPLKGARGPARAEAGIGVSNPNAHSSVQFFNRRPIRSAAPRERCDGAVHQRLQPGS